MTRIEELIVELDGKIAYADATGNMDSKRELCELKSELNMLQSGRDKEHLCVNCSRGDLGNCFQKPNIVVNRKVISCTMFRS